jgi:hypothetical protein
MVSRENAVVFGFGIAALLLGYGGRAFADASTAVLIGTILFVGVVVPQLLNAYLDRKQGE